MELISDFKKLGFLVVVGCVLFILFLILNPSIAVKRTITIGNMFRFGVPVIILAALMYFVLIH